MADNRLLPCPFCGGEAEIREIFVAGFHKPLFIAKCRNIGCGAIGSECVKEETAIERWNNRHSPWHTGTPTDDGLYSVYYLDDHNPSATPYEVLYDGFLSPDGEGNWIDRDGERRFIDDDIVRWQKIELYKEK